MNEHCEIICPKCNTNNRVYLGRDTSTEAFTCYSCSKLSWLSDDVKRETQDIGTTLCDAILEDGEPTYADLSDQLAAANEELSDAQQKIDRWKEASMLLVNGDPGGVTPDMLERDRTEQQAIIDKLREANIWGFDDACVTSIGEYASEGDWDIGTTFELWANRAFGVFRYKVTSRDCDNGPPTDFRIIGVQKSLNKWIDVDAATEAEAIEQAEAAKEQTNGK